MNPFQDFHQKDWEHCWFRFQWRQELHDRLFHSDIYNLAKPHRLTHLVLHHAKYVAQLHTLVREYTNLLTTGMDRGPNAARLKRLCVDGLIVSMSMYNVANKLFTDAQPGIHTFSAEESINVLIRNMGNLAKVVEDVDHMAQSNPLGSMVEHLNVMCQCYLSLYAAGVDQTLDAGGNGAMRRLFIDLEERLVEVEKKSMFYDELKTQIDQATKEQW